MSYKLISQCPVCSSELKATRLSCSTCGTTIESEFTLSKFELLSIEHLNFVEIFLKNRGSIKDVEREMGISYPTVKAKLNDVLKALGYTIEEEPIQQSELNQIIEELDKGNINVDEAIKKIKK
ncbi:MAG: DUF2089 domain-containing protein [Ignavibacteriae bacterium]|nr:MAG: DUF2089 domain-containing protein [Ignavibacteriota bacterium]